MSLEDTLSKIWAESSAVFTNSGYSFFKIEAHVVCAAVLVILFYRQQNSSDQTEARLTWSRLLFVQILYCISGIIRVLIDVDIIPKTIASQYVITAVNFGLFGCMCWLVFMYIELYQISKLLESGTRRLISALPFAFNTAMLVLSAFTGWFVSFDNGDMERGILYPLMMAINFAYPVAAVFLSVRRRKKMTLYERNTIPVMAIYPAFFMICGPLQDINWRIPFLCYVIVISDIFVYISYADSLVSVDPLTKISNRNELMRVLSDRLIKNENTETLHVFAVDIDELGTVNANYGRQEGDKILVMTADALKKFSREEHNCYISRYYGDEFILTADINDDEERELFAEHIRNYVSNAAMSMKLPYHVRVNIGWSKFEHYSKTETISGLIEEAEKMMNENKEQRKFQKIWHNA